MPGAECRARLGHTAHGEDSEDEVRLRSTLNLLNSLILSFRSPLCLSLPTPCPPLARGRPSGARWGHGPSSMRGRERFNASVPLLGSPASQGPGRAQAEVAPTSASAGGSAPPEWGGGSGTQGVTRHRPDAAPGWEGRGPKF
eukprot:scaffold1243_cov403-Prasinococcus_capsulatus_cf.AAC.29